MGLIVKVILYYSYKSFYRFYMLAEDDLDSLFSFAQILTYQIHLLLHMLEALNYFKSDSYSMTHSDDESYFKMFLWLSHTWLVLVPHSRIELGSRIKKKTSKPK